MSESPGTPACPPDDSHGSHVRAGVPTSISSDDPYVTADQVSSAIALSIVLPAYNEAGRLPRYLESIRNYLGVPGRHPYEVIVVDDGSSDHLLTALARTRDGWPQLQVIRHPRNLGKGAAVRTGVLAAAGDWILFADADGATPIEEERKLAAALAAGADLAVGSRLIADERVKRRRTWGRAALGRAFAALARRMFSLPVRDTQCGFKMFRSARAQRLFALVPGDRLPVRHRDSGIGTALRLSYGRGPDSLVRAAGKSYEPAEGRGRCRCRPVPSPAASQEAAHEL